VISIIVANYNKASYIEATIRSALVQDSVSQVIVVDDASTDGSLDVLRNLAREDSRVLLVALAQNRGQSFSENRGLERATGKYVLYLDSDDLLEPGCCAGRVEVAESEPNADAWVFPMATFADSPQRPVGAWIPRPGNHLQHFLSHRLDWQLMQAIWRREFLDRIGGFDESFMRLTDVSLHTRALLAGARVRCYPNRATDCLYRISPERYSWSVDKLATRHVTGAIHYVTIYRDLVPVHMSHLLSGTLLAILETLVHWWRIGKLSNRDFIALSDRLLEHAPSASQRKVLRIYRFMHRISPVRVRGLGWAARRALRLP
jgi:glycosyltransferase involved in cell wall biosynthesis